MVDIPGPNAGWSVQISKVAFSAEPSDCFDSKCWF